MSNLQKNFKNENIFFIQNSRKIKVYNSIIYTKFVAHKYLKDMKFNEGDKVKFINESGGGYIKKIISSSVVEVTTADGFNIPYSTTDLLLVDDQGVASNFFDEDFGEKPDIDKQKEDSNPHHVSTELFKRQSLDLKPGFYLAFVPQDQKWLMTGFIDVFLLNHTDYETIFSFYLKAGEKFENQDYDIVESHNKYLLNTIDREDINDWLNGHVQLLFVKSELEKMIAPLNKTYQIKGTKFYQEGNFKHVDILDANALIVEMVQMDYQEIISKNPDQQKDIQPIEEPKAKVKKQKSLIHNYKIGPLEAEIDLHISALVDDFSYMKPHEIVSHQMDFFNRTLEDAMLNQFEKIIYIHGIGNGTLKKKLKDELRDYEEIEVRDASFNRYGYGAIEIQIKYQ